MKISDVFRPGGILAGHLAGYEPRPGQQQMAEAVADTLAEPDQRSCLVVEAETGLGKTLAYLVPAVLSGRRVVVSTNTRNLQDQILQREIPFIQQYIDPTLKALCVKGRENYLCLYRWHQYAADRQAGLFEDESVEDIGRWLEKTRFGDRSELEWLPGNSPLWRKICCLSHICPGSDCPESASCLLNSLRRAAAASRLLVVNHHLLFSDLAVRRSGYGEVLPRYEAVIFDEAHHLENVATAFFGHTFSRYQVLDLLADVERSAHKDLAGRKQAAVITAAGSLIGALNLFISIFPAEPGRFQFDGLLAARPDLLRGRDSLLHGLERLAEKVEDLDSREEPWGQYSLRARELAARLTAVTAESFADLPADEVRAVHWYEQRQKNLVLSATPIDVAPDLQETLFAEVPHTVFTSATLSAGGDFSYFLQRLGLPAETGTMTFPSPFDYANRTLLYVPDNSFPSPQVPEYSKILHERISQLINLSGGRALVLFTSIQAMEYAYRELSGRLAYPLLVQGSAPRRRLLSQFAGETESVLLAVASFWEGVDIPGESLSLVIIDKLPFEVPSDPVMVARLNSIRAAGGNPFFDFQVPRAVLSLRQGLGRLMRRSSDCGVMAVLDVRLFTKSYGRRFLSSLPSSPVCRDLETVRKFFSEEEHGPGC